MKHEITLNEFQESCKHNIKIDLSERDKAVHCICILGDRVGKVLGTIQKIGYCSGVERGVLKDDLCDMLCAISEVSKYFGFTLNEVGSGDNLTVEHEN